jgi:GNAT superfamily N-acetyltransferase
VAINIINFESKYQSDFKSLNLEWLDKYNLTESHDLEILDDPQGTVIARGGFIFLAMDENKVIGTAGLWKESEAEYELIKMFVDTAYRGRGISKLLLDKCIDEAKHLGAKKIFLYSNSQLKTAIQLYTKYGFEHIPVVNAPFLTADIKMELSL